MLRPTTRVVLLGFGAINSQVADLLAARKPNVQIVGVITERAPQSIPRGAVRVTTAEELVSIAPDVVIEAASRDAVREWGEHALRAAHRLVVSSTSAFVNETLLESLRSTAQSHGSQVVISPGAIGGVDALAAASRAGLDEVVHRIVKHPARWPYMPPPSTRPAVIFRGSAREAATRYPLNANVTVMTALSGLGLDQTTVELVADSSAIRNRHEITASGTFGSLNILIENHALPANPRSSALAALALVRQIENEASELVL